MDLLPFNDLDFHFDSVVWVIISVPRLRHDLIHDIHTAYDFSENCVLPVKERRILHTDEELRACTIRIRSSCHGQGTTLVRSVVKFCLNCVSWTTQSMGSLVGIL